MDEMTPREVAELWLKRGASVLPLRADKAPVTHLVPRGFHQASHKESELWWFDHDDTAMVGVVPGSMQLLVLDVDVKHGVKGDVHLAELEAEHSLIPRGAQATTVSGGKHIYLRKRDAFVDIGNSDACEGVNVRSDNGYVVATGSPGYTLHQAWPESWESVPECPEWLWERLLSAEYQQSAEANYEAPSEHVEEDWHPKVRVAFDIFTGQGDRHTTMAEAVMTLASHELIGLAGSTAALRELEARFVEAVRDRSSAAEATREFKRALDGARQRVQERPSTVVEEQTADRSFIEAIAEQAAERAVEMIDQREKPVDLLHIWTIRELLEDEQEISWLVPNILRADTYGQMAGEMKSCKTWNSLFLGASVASGKDYLGVYSVHKPGTVVVFVGEGSRFGWRGRIARVLSSYGISDEDQKDLPIHVIFEKAPVMSEKFQRTVDYIISDLDPALTLIDPLMAYHGAEVNSASLHEEGALLNSMSSPFIEHGSTLLVLNHFNKTGSGRGFSRITMAGSGEWSDSWCFMTVREEPDLAAGKFFVGAEFGNRDTGGKKLDIDLELGTPDTFGRITAPLKFSCRESSAEA